MSVDAGSQRLQAVLSERIGTYVKRLDQFIMSAKTVALRPLGLTVPQYATLLAIHHLQPTSGAQLARAALTTPQTMSTILANLEAKALIVRMVSVIHHKLFEVRLTPAGEELVAQADSIALRIESQLRTAIGDERFADLVATAQILEAAFPGGAESA